MMASFVVVCCHLIFPILPQFYWLIPTFTLLLLLRSFRFSYLLLSAIFALFTLWLTLHWYSTWHLGENYNHQDYLIEGRVLSATTENTSSRYSEFLLRADTIGKRQFYVLKPKLQLRWYQPEFTPKQGNKIKVFATIKPLGSYANPGKRFNSQKYLTAQGIKKIAVIKSSPSNTIIDSQTTIRQKLIDDTSAYSLLYTPWLLALGVGYRDGLDKHDWQLLQATSTAHLFSISGMHLALVAGYLIIISRTCAPILSSVLKTHRSLLKMTSGLVLLGCFFYTELAGSQLPVLRAFLAVSVVVICLQMDVTLTSFQLFTRIIFFISLLYPLSLMSSSFWLSFGAVFLLLMVTTFKKNTIQQGVVAKIRAAITIQWAFFLIGLPLSLYLWDQHTFISILANAVLIPLVSVLILPLLLLGLFAEVLGIPSVWILLICDFAMHVSIELLERLFSTQEAIDGHHFGPVWIVTLASIALLFWRVQRMVALSLLGLCCLWAYKLAPQQDTELVFFDVGHGSSAVLRHPDANIIFDFAKGNEQQSIFTREISPYFSKLNIDKVDLGVLSHFDSDHAGGGYHLLKHDLINELWSPRGLCRVGKRLELSDVAITVLWPLVTSAADANEESCVVLLRVGDTKVLFAGDISANEERAIIKQWPDLEVDVLLAPHHGSRTSSSYTFVGALAPKVVVFSTSYPNHWGHPHQEVVARYERIGAKIYHLGKSGALTINWQGDEIKLSTVREDLYNRWYYKK